MKKTFKILGISIAAFLGVVLIVAAVLVWLVFTPSRLTPIVRSVADKMILCEHHIGQVELTFFSSFPQFTLAVDSVLLVNDVEGDACDTLLRADCLRAEVNLRKLWQEKAIALDALLLDGAQICLFTDSIGQTNYDVFVTDTVADEPDTTSFSFPFEWMDLQKVSLNQARIHYVDEQRNVKAYLDDASVNLSVKWQGERVNGLVGLNVPHLTASMEGITYAHDIAVVSQLPFDLQLDELKLHLNKASLAINQFGVNVDGSVALPANGDVHTDFSVAFEQWDIPEVLRLVPDSFAYLLTDLTVDTGRLGISADVKGVLNDTLYPKVLAHIQLEDAGFAYAGLPMPLHAVNADVVLAANLNDSTDTYADIKHFSASMQQSSVTLKGKVERLLADAACDVTLSLDACLEELHPFLPADLDMDMKGVCNGQVQACFTLDQLTNGAYEKMHVVGDVRMERLAVVFADWNVNMPKGNLRMQLPHQVRTTPMNFASGNLTFDGLSVTQGDSVALNAKDMSVALSLSNPLKGDMLYAGCEINSEYLGAVYGSAKGDLSAAQMMATIAYNRKDTTDVPLVDASLVVNRLTGAMDSLEIALQSPHLKVSMQSSKKNKKEPIINLDYAGDALAFSMGQMLTMSTDSLSLSAYTRHRSGAENILLEWNPKVAVNLTQGEVKLSEFKEKIEIPTIRFDYSNRDFEIYDSRIQLGNSDFQLKGEIKDIHKFLSKQGLLKGELEFVSQTTDVNQLMDLVSGLGSTEEEVAETSAEITTNEAQSESMPFIVPKGVDLTLHTNIKRALVGEQVATNLGGNLYVKDGTLILEEMGFICDAARLQLTAMYKSPRPNHLYVGLDYHMTDIQIEELIKMVPQVDSVLPMLRSFRGKGEFHLAAETNLTRNYDVKWSTLRGAASIQGKDLVLLDGETFSQIAKLMLFKKKTENKIDSISVEATVFRNEVDIFPFMVSMDKYKVALGGRHNLDMTFNYHLSLLSPLRMGVDVSGNFDDLKIKPTKCKYAEDFRPAERKVVETQNTTFRELIRQALVSTLKQEE